MGLEEGVQGISYWKLVSQSGQMKTSFEFVLKDLLFDPCLRSWEYARRGIIAGSQEM